MAELPSYPIPSDEIERLIALESYNSPGSGPERSLDVILRHVRRVFGVPIAIVSFVEQHREHFRARLGIDSCGSEREGSFCTHAILERDVMVVPDATLDERFYGSPLVNGTPGIRFYAGAPLVTPEGYVIGTLCIKDTIPRPQGLSIGEQQSLAELAELVMDKLEARRLSTAEADGRRRFDAVAGSAADAIICGDGDNRILSWNGAAERMFGYTAAEAIGQSMTIIVPEQYRCMHEAGVRRAAAGHPTKLVGSLVTVPSVRRDGTEFPIELSLSHWLEAGEHRFGAIVRDITERLNHEASLKRAAEYDALTELPNRTVLHERLARASAEKRSVSLVMLDLDGFKDVNDSLGHAAGDDVLKLVAVRLRETVGTEALACRLGGDEFEPPRHSRRPHFLREWGHHDETDIEEIFAGGPGAGCPNGSRASSRLRVAVGGHFLHCGEDRLLGRDIAQMGATGRAGSGRARRADERGARPDQGSRTRGPRAATGQ